MTPRRTDGTERGSALLSDRFKIILGVVNMAERSGAWPYQRLRSPFVSKQSQS